MLTLRPAPVQASAPATAAAVVALARTLVGTPYAYIGDAPETGFSCIGFVHYLYARVGLAVPENLILAYAAAPHVAQRDLQAGDLVFFSDTVWPGLSHVALYAGAGQLIGADNYTTGVEVTPLAAAYWQQHYTGSTRPLANSSGTASPRLVPVVATRVPAWHVGQIVRGRSVASVYSGPGTYYQLIDALAPRDRLQIVHWQGDWVQISYPRFGMQTYGWVNGSYLRAQSAALRARSAVAAARSPSAVTVAVAALHLRRGPATTTPVLALLKRGTRLVLVGRRGTWDHVRLSTISGWVIANAVTSATTAPPSRRIV
jgi:uncharacterized protein YraI